MDVYGSHGLRRREKFTQKGKLERNEWSLFNLVIRCISYCIVILDIFEFVFSLFYTFHLFHLCWAEFQVSSGSLSIMEPPPLACGRDCEQVGQRHFD